MAPNPSRLLLWGALVGIGVAWGSTQALSKVIVSAGHDPLGISLNATLLGSVLITGVLIARKISLPLGRRFLIYYAICGLLGTALPNYTSYTSLRELPVGIVAIILASVPLMTFLLALAAGIDRPGRRRVLGLLAGAAAVLLLIGPEASLPRPGDALWVGVAILTGLSYAIENIYIAKYRPESVGAMQTLCGLSWMAVLMVLPLTWVTGYWMPMTHPGAPQIALVVMSVLHLVAYGGFVWLITKGGPVFAAQVAYVVTLAGVLLGMAFFDEAHSAWVWAALGLMLAGLALVQPREGQNRQSKQ